MKIETKHNIGDHVWVIREATTRKQVYCSECHATEAREDILAIETDTARGNSRRVVCAKCHGRAPEWVSSHILISDSGRVIGFRTDVNRERTRVEYQIVLDNGGDVMEMVQKLYDTREECEAAIERINEKRGEEESK